MVSYSGLEKTLVAVREENDLRLIHALEYLGGTMRQGGERINETEPKHRGLLRADFERAWKSYREVRQ